MVLAVVASTYHAGDGDPLSSHGDPSQSRIGCAPLFTRRGGGYCVAVTHGALDRRKQVVDRAVLAHDPAIYDRQAHRSYVRLPVPPMSRSISSPWASSDHIRIRERIARRRASETYSCTGSIPRSSVRSWTSRMWP